MIVPESVTSIYNITDSIGTIMTGNPGKGLNLTLSVDSKDIVFQMRMKAAEYKHNYGYNIPVHVLADKMGENN